MKKYKLVILCIFAFEIVFSQGKLSNSKATDPLVASPKFNEWSIEIGSGISNGIRPYTDGYFTNHNNQVFNNFSINSFTIGAKYNISPIIAVKMDVNFDKFNNKQGSKSKAFEVYQYRTSVQGEFNLNSFLKDKNNISKFNLLFHGGLSIGVIKPVAVDKFNYLSNGDNYVAFVYGIKPTFKVGKITSVFLDFSSYNNYGQNLTWNGLHAKASDNTAGQMYSLVLGLSYSLDKNPQ